MDQNPLFSLTGQNCSPALVHRVVSEKVVAFWSRWRRQRHWDPALPRAPPPGSALRMPQLYLHPGHGSYFCLALESIDTEISSICLLAGESCECRKAGWLSFGFPFYYMTDAVSIVWRCLTKFFHFKWRQRRTETRDDSETTKKAATGSESFWGRSADKHDI